jgi:glycosyltransferase involved in cell wall biosynthesis
MRATIIIPTRGARGSLAATLKSVGDDGPHGGELEVVLVVDGGREAEPLEDLGERVDRVLRLDRQGAAEARNRAAEQARGRDLVFVDDDVTLEAGALEALVQRCEHEDVLAQPTIEQRARDASSPYARWAAAVEAERQRDHPDPPYPWQFCVTQALAMRAETLAQLGGFHSFAPLDGTGAGWEDVELAYRASLRGVWLVRLPEARAVHWDYSLSAYALASRRFFEVSRTAAFLFAQRPEMAHHLPMYRDKLPLDRSADGVWLRIRKGLRRIASSTGALALLELLIGLGERIAPIPGLLAPIYRWAIGAHIYRGLAAGLRQQASAARGPRT